ncbi:hypothetical protein T4D_15762 [Trichinella pseudospiralis]|uniref:Uncharacterized protein n=1 Tax=Trichinella pseudospiralis TaxID=6337 RepID=A0A0V1FFF9_TRIPS|nr:hypothetical protein T4D_15762 [Trichinella pseudospiralis]
MILSGRLSQLCINVDICENLPVALFFTILQVFHCCIGKNSAKKESTFVIDENFFSANFFFIGSITNIKAHQMVEKLHGCLDQQAPLHNPPGTAVPAVLFTDARRLLQPSSKCCSGVRLLVSNGRQYDELAD